MQNRQRWGGKHLLCEFPKDVCGVKKKSSVFLSFRDAASWASWPLTWVTSFFFFVSLKELLLEGLIFHHRRQRWRRWRWFHLKSAPETRTLLKNRFILLYYQFSIFLVPPAFRRAVPTYLLPFLNVSKKESLLSFTRQSVHPLVELVL